MDSMNFQIVAGILSTIIFSVSNIPMLIKAAKTHDLKSYSRTNLILGNVGNLIHWAYIVYLPFGPIWFLHGFYTISAMFMLFWYFRYEGGASASPQYSLCLVKNIGRSTLGRIQPLIGKRDKQLSAIGRTHSPALAC